MPDPYIKRIRVFFAGTVIDPSPNYDNLVKHFTERIKVKQLTVIGANANGQAIIHIQPDALAVDIDAADFTFYQGKTLELAAQVAGADDGFTAPDTGFFAAGDFFLAAVTVGQTGVGWQGNTERHALS